jgi:hypothetical protein
MASKKPALNKAAQARRNVESAALQPKLKAAAKGTGPIKSAAEKRMSTRSAVKNSAIKDQNK